MLAGVGVLSAREPLFEGLGSYSRSITTASPKAQQYLNQGLGFYYGFNHDAAIGVSGSDASCSDMRDGALGDRAGERVATCQNKCE
jgi:hypothetical protein